MAHVIDVTKEMIIKHFHEAYGDPDLSSESFEANVSNLLDGFTTTVREADCKAICEDCLHGYPISHDDSAKEGFKYYHQVGEHEEVFCKASPMRELEK